MKENHSIEGVFKTVTSILEKEIDVQSYYTKRQLDVLSILRIRSLCADVHHITGAVNYLAFGLSPSKTVLTIHDVGFYENPVNRGFKRWVYGLLWMQLPMKRVKAITTVSEFTKGRLQEIFSISSSKIHVIPNPVADQFTFHLSRPNGEAFRILQIGTGAHKNLESLILASRGLAVHLTIIGYPSFTSLQLLSESKISFDVRKDLGLEELVAAYVESDILFFASLYEGFGVPIVEAQRIGRPVITSAFGAMKEVAGDGALFVSPLNIDEIRNAIIQLSRRGRLYDDLVEKGLKNAMRFRNDRIARQYLDLYRSLV